MTVRRDEWRTNGSPWAKDGRNRVTAYCDTDLVHASYLFTGLLELEVAGEIELDCALRDGSVPGVRGPFTAWLKVQAGDDRPRSVCWDNHDSSDYVCQASSDACDLYLKTNFSSRTPRAMPEGRRSIVHPAGPHTPCRPRSERHLPLRVLGNSFAHLRRRILNPGRETSLVDKVREVAFYARRVRGYLKRQVWTRYERPFEASTTEVGTPFVFFNPSCWPEASVDAREVNEFRRAVIVGLREALGKDFEGGFRASALASEKYPDALERRPYTHQEYLELLQRTPVALYTNGLSGCFSWRFVEEMAASKCLVAERIPDDAGWPLDESAGILQASDPHQLVQTVVDLHKNRMRVEEMRRRAWAAYSRHLRPSVAVRRLLTLAADGGPGRA